MKSGPSKVISHRTGKLKCDPGHILKVNRNGSECSVRAKDLDTKTDMLYSYDESLVDFRVADGPVEDFYDIEIADPHWYYTSDIVSHNSVLLCNNAITSYKGRNDRGTLGQNVLFVTFELDKIKTAMRCLGVLMETTPMNSMYDNKGMVLEAVTKHKATYDGNIFITELPPDECSVNHVYSVIDIMKRSHGWKPDVVILDYMDLMVSRRSSYNDGDYSRQKSVANEIRGLAKNENVLIYSATQLNRGDGSNQLAGLDRAAESYGKQFSMDYVVTINQSSGELAMSPPQFRLLIAKNRNGKKGVVVTVSVDFSTMYARDMGLSTRMQ